MTLAEITQALQALSREGHPADRANYNEVHRLLQTLWTRHACCLGYDKATDKPLWMELENAIYKLVTDGPGPLIAGKGGRMA